MIRLLPAASAARKSLDDRDSDDHLSTPPATCCGCTSRAILVSATTTARTTDARAARTVGLTTLSDGGDLRRYSPVTAISTVIAVTLSFKSEQHAAVAKS